MSGNSEQASALPSLRTEVITRRSPLPALAMAGRHFRVEVTGTYLDPDDEDKKKTAFKAQLCYRFPLLSQSRASKTVDLETCVGDRISTVELAREWAEPKGLIINGKGALNFNLVHEKEHYYIEVGGQDDRCFTVVYGTFGAKNQRQPAKSVLAKLRTNKEWKLAMDLDKQLQWMEWGLEVTVETVSFDTATEECSCCEHIAGSMNASRINWELKSTDDLSKTPNSC